MTAAYAIDWFKETLWMAVVVSAPPVLAVVIVGLIIAVLQAATQISDQAVAFGPKALAAVATLVFFSSWIVSRLSEFMVALLTAIGQMHA